MIENKWGSREKWYGKERTILHRSVIAPLAIVAVLVFLAPGQSVAGPGGTKLNVPLVEPGPGSVASGYEKWTGTCRGPLVEHGFLISTDPTHYHKGTLQKGTVTYKETNGNGEEVTKTWTGTYGKKGNRIVLCSGFGSRQPSSTLPVTKQTGKSLDPRTAAQ